MTGYYNKIAERQKRKVKHNILKRETRNWEIQYLYEILNWTPERIAHKFNLSTQTIYNVITPSM